MKFIRRHKTCRLQNDSFKLCNPVELQRPQKYINHWNHLQTDTRFYRVTERIEAAEFFLYFTTMSLSVKSKPAHRGSRTSASHRSIKLNTPEYSPDITFVSTNCLNEATRLVRLRVQTLTWSNSLVLFLSKWMAIIGPNGLFRTIQCSRGSEKLWLGASPLLSRNSIRTVLHLHPYGLL